MIAVAGLPSYTLHALWQACSWIDCVIYIMHRHALTVAHICMLESTSKITSGKVLFQKVYGLGFVHQNTRIST